MAEILFALHDDPAPLVDAISTTPVAFLHGDWKMANLGSHPDGRTILVDWSFPGSGPPCAELAHYLALNRSRVPEAEGSGHRRVPRIARVAGHRHQRLVGSADRAQPARDHGALGWEKALGDDAELRWWEARVAEGAALL